MSHGEWLDDYEDWELVCELDDRGAAFLSEKDLHELHRLYTKEREKFYKKLEEIFYEKIKKVC